MILKNDSSAQETNYVLQLSIVELMTLVHNEANAVTRGQGKLLWLTIMHAPTEQDVVELLTEVEAKLGKRLPLTRLFFLDKLQNGVKTQLSAEQLSDAFKKHILC